MREDGVSLSVLVIDENPDVLAFLARFLDANGMRALLARNAAEALDVAARGYVPIDLVIANVLLPPDPAAPARGDAPDLVDRLRRLRPHLHALYMSARLDSGVIRIELLERNLQHLARMPDESSFLDAIRNAAEGRPLGTPKSRAAT